MCTSIIRYKTILRGDENEKLADLMDLGRANDRVKQKSNAESAEKI